MPLLCTKHLSRQSASILIAFEVFGLFVSTRTPNSFWGGNVVLVLEILYLLFDFQLFTMVK